jgi:hypothetical protein
MRINEQLIDFRGPRGEIVDVTSPETAAKVPQRYDEFFESEHNTLPHSLINQDKV